MGFTSTPTLPAELWLHIADWLGERDIFSLFRTNRAFNKALVWYLYHRNCRSGQTALLWAAKHSVLPLLTAMLSIPFVNVNVKDRFDQTPLSLAAKYGHIAAVHLLLTSPAIDVNAADSYSRAPLCHAAQNGHEPIVDALLRVPGINVNAGTFYEDSPLYLSIANRHQTIALKLLNRTNLDPVDGVGTAPEVQANCLKLGLILDYILQNKSVDTKKINYKSEMVSHTSQKDKSRLPLS